MHPHRLSQNFGKESGSRSPDRETGLFYGKYFYKMTKVLLFLIIWNFVCIIIDVPLLKAQMYYPDDPIWVDPDQNDIPPPRPIKIGQIYDFLASTLRGYGVQSSPRALNINTIDEVPDSSWFTNRLSRYPMTLQELRRGPRRGKGPDTRYPWLVVGAKTEGITPGFTIEDAQGDRYIIKFDPYDYPQLATSAEVIGTLFFYALGYHVPENYLVTVDPSRIRVAPGLKVNGRRITMRDIKKILARAGRLRDSSIQALASKYLPGKPLGPFLYYGTRSDDPNDIYPHEHRRELRALKVFGAWLNHHDMRNINTLDMYVEDDGRRFIRHYLIDFGGLFGSDVVEPQNGRAGFEFIIEWKPILKSFFTLGIWDRKWRKLGVQYRFRSIGPYEAELFDPLRWRTDYPNAAVLHARADDAFWAIRVLLRFTEPMVRAMVEEGHLEEPGAEEYLIKTIMQRRDKIIRAYLPLINPLYNFSVSQSTNSKTHLLCFQNAGEEYGLARGSKYKAQWYRFNNEDGTMTEIGNAVFSEAPCFALPGSDARFLAVSIKTLHPHFPAWSSKITVVLDQERTAPIVGIQRDVEYENQTGTLSK